MDDFIFSTHNLFLESIDQFEGQDPHLRALAQLPYQHSSTWWKALDVNVPGIYILTGGRQIGKSTSCKLLLLYCLTKKLILAKNCFYLPCDEVFDAKELSQLIRGFLAKASAPFLLVVDEVTFVKGWDRVIKSLADEGHFTRGVCLLTGSDTLILKEAAMRFPGRRGCAEKTDFHIFPLCFFEYVSLVQSNKKKPSAEKLSLLFDQFLKCGGYLRAMNDLARHQKITTATFQTYEQWIRGDFLKQGKNEEYLLAVLKALLTVGVSQVSYSTLTQKIGLLSKETCMDYCRLLERMDILFDLQAFDQNKKQGFPRKDRKFHFFDPFIYRTIFQWLKREQRIGDFDFTSTLVEACVASHCYRKNPSYYFKGQGEVDVLYLQGQTTQAIEIKWGTQIRVSDLKTLKQFNNTVILGKEPVRGSINGTPYLSVYEFLFDLR